ncbi:Monooxygenase FAD-binding protein [Neofusicoccum parvum]|uniref:Monooxygenase FAD-binding protein n=1 Tax=Neofusicoccum parvum TaxID=310453 RepID=A0ACB5S2P6_9PEZI|nr:Monooxygenase FAD-binding protein [Neofusicoccum parvum]
MGLKVIIAGGSVAGLTLALVLQHAGVDFELLEKGDFAPQLGASIGIQPHGARILDQLGLWEEISSQIVPLRYRKHYDSEGRLFDGEGLPVAFIERCEFLRILHSNLTDKSRLHAHKEVCSYEETESGVTVTVSDGSTYEGTILVGADGVHSKTRKLMSEKLRPKNKELWKNLQECYTSEYKCVFAVTRNDQASPFMADARAVFTYRKDYSTIAATGVKGLVFWFLFVKTPFSCTPHCPRFSEEDMDALIEEYGDDQIVPGATIRDFYNARVKASLVPLEEGIVQKWSHGRVVLIGDAVHKVTINAGLGGNMAIEGVARLTNLLLPLLHNSSDLSTEQLEGVFSQYEIEQKARAQTTLTASAGITRAESEQNWLYRAVTRWVVPTLSDNVKAKLYTAYSSGGTYLNFLPRSARDISRLEARRASQSKSWVSWALGY